MIDSPDLLTFPAAMPTLETDRLILRELTPADNAAIFALFSDPRVTESTDIGTFERIAQADELIASFALRFAARGALRWGITLKGDGTAIGTVGFPGMDDETRRGEVGYDVARAHWGRGIATEATRAAVRFGFEGLNPNRIEATTNLGNMASMRVLAKIGFTEEGILRDYRYWAADSMMCACSRCCAGSTAGTPRHDDGI